ncbi:hypothetical protein BD560DRAFT_474562 [Blakeslea trispora]|nr:hypothetical protein BD560DRAFT_474562 [Blakeslea trispora]
MDIKTQEAFILSHGVIMTFVWAFAVPFAVGANMFARKKGKPWGPRIHISVMTVAVVIPFTIAAAFAFTSVGYLKKRDHNAIGTVLTFGTWLQIILGTINHLLFRRRLKNNRLPTQRPWHNHLHIWLGRLLLTLALVNLPLGIKAYQANLPAYIAYGIWLFVLLVAFIWLISMPNIEVEQCAKDMKSFLILYAALGILFYSFECVYDTN